MIDQKEIERIKNLKGFARGQSMISTFQAVLAMEGKEGLKKLQAKLKEMTLWVKEYEDPPKNIKTFQWYPLWYDVLPVLVAADLFNWNNERIRQFGVFVQKASFLERLFLKYFVSIKIAARTVGEHWKKHYSLGELKAVKINEKENSIGFGGLCGSSSLLPRAGGPFPSNPGHDSCYQNKISRGKMPL